LKFVSSPFALMMDDTKPPKPMAVLSDHKRVGKTLVPLPATFGWTHVNFVQRIFPEIIWIGFLLERCGARRGIELAANLVEIAYKEATKKPQPEFAFLSAQRELSDEDWVRIRKGLANVENLTDLRKGLESFVRCYPKDNPLRKLWADEGPGDFTADDVAFARKLTRPRLNRWSFEGTIMQSVVLYAEALTGRLSYTANVKPPNLEALYHDFESEEGRRASAHSRTHTTTTFAFYAERLGSSWAEYFWKRGLELDPVLSHLRPRKPSRPHDHVLLRLRADFERMATEVLTEIAEKLIQTGVAEEVHAVVTGLLARQATLAIGVVNNIETWNWDHGPLYLRAMTDCYIALAWILMKPEERSRLYILHGLGQEKLWMAHYEEVLKNATDEQEKKMAEGMLEASKAWVEGQLFLFFVSVNLGAWAGKSAREMAEEVGCLDLYNYAYTPYSFSAHSTWNHVGKFNSVPTESPLNKDMRMPVIPHYGADPSIAFNAAKYLSKAFGAVIKKFEVKIENVLPWEWMVGRMGEVEEFLSGRRSHQEWQG